MIVTNTAHVVIASFVKKGITLNKGFLSFDVAVNHKPAKTIVLPLLEMILIKSTRLEYMRKDYRIMLCDMSPIILKQGRPVEQRQIEEFYYVFWSPFVALMNNFVIYSPRVNYSVKTKIFYQTFDI